MKRVLVILSLIVLSLIAQAQLDKIVIPAGSPEDVALQAIANEQDAQKKIARYEDFLQKFSSNPAAVAYGNWQISQSYQTSGDLDKALSYGDKALAASPRNLDILVSQTNIAQQMKDGGKVMDYAVKGGQAYDSIAKQPKLPEVSDQDFATAVADAKQENRNSYEFLEVAAYNSIADEKNAKTRMAYIERFTPAFPGSRFQEPVMQYAMMTLSELNDSARMYSYGEKALAANPNSMATLRLLAGAYVEDSKSASVAKAVTYSQKVIELAKADAPDADRSRKLSAGVAHSTLGYAYMKQDKTAAAIPELKVASALLKGQDEATYSTVLYRLGYGYAKLNKLSEAREVLSEASNTPGPAQQLSRDLLAKVNTARAKGK
jgi:tetratricopeptide (TPR) repeat protein